MSGTEGECGMTIWDTIFKAVFVVAVPITLAVYACVYVGERAEHDVARPRPPRRRPPGADAEGGSVSGNLENGAGI